MHDSARLIVRFLAAGKAEQMDLVIPCDPHTGGVIYDRAIQYLARFRGCHRQRAADQPDPMFARHV